MTCSESSLIKVASVRFYSKSYSLIDVLKAIDYKNSLMPTSF